MKQLNITFLLTVLMSMVGVKSFAYDAKVNGIYYSFSGAEATVTCRYFDGVGYSSCDYSGNIVIPETVTYNGITYKVTAIDDYAFFECTSLISVTIPNSVTSIGYQAFYKCSGLTSVTIPNSVTSIGYQAFSGCSGLTSVTIPNSVTSIGGYAFGGTAWYNNQPEGLVYAGKVVYDYKGTMPANTSISLTEGTVGIAEYAFSSCSGLTSVTIPNSVTSIGEGAFSGTAWYNNQADGVVYAGKVAYEYKGTMPANTSISLAEGTVGIAEYAFYGCSNLTSVTIPNSVISIGQKAFSDCIGLTSITVETGNTVYDSRENCNAIIETSTNTVIAGCMTTVMPNNVTAIGAEAFYSCRGLTSVTIGSSVTSIGNKAFMYCSGLTSVNIPNSVKRIGYKSFSKTGLTSITIPNSVMSIGDAAFWKCKSLTTVSIGNGIKIINYAAFSKCTALKDVYCFAKNVPTTEDAAFYNANTGTLHVPASSISYYKSKEPWKSFGKIVGFSDTDINKLTLDNQKCKKGTQVILPIGLTNQKQITGIQLDLYLPNGITVAKKSNGKMQVSVTERMDGNYTIISSTMDNFIRIIGYSADGDTFSRNDGAILNVTLNIDENLADGDYNIYLKDIVLSEEDNTEYHPANVVGKLTVKSDMLGDVDGSGAININDVVCIINYILNRPTDTFVFEAADVDENGIVNINDVVLLINRYILKNISAPALSNRAVQRSAIENGNFLHLADIEINPGETKTVELLMTNADEVKGTQGNIKLPAGLSFVKKSNGKVDAANINDRSEDFTLSCQIQDDGSLTFAHYSGDGFAFEGNSGGVFTFKIVADEDATAGTYSIDLTGVVLSIDGVGYDLPDRTSLLTVLGTSGILPNVNDNDNDNYYTLDGRKLQGKPTQKGVYIVNGHKVVVN